ncbi:hypothetical protein JW824_14895 [bacterium]|nr:hypothetical protein [bacterium]
MFRKMAFHFYLDILILMGIGFNEYCIAETVVIIAEGEYVMGSGETMEVAEERARKSAMQSAAEQAGAFVKSYTEVKNFVLESDVIEVIANHSMQVEVLDMQKIVLGNVDAIRFYVKIQATMTEEEIEANLQKVREDQSIVDAYNRLKADYEKQNIEMEQLKRQLEMAVGGDRQEIARLISEEEKKFKANLWVEKAQQSSYFSDEALNAYIKAVELNPGLAEAYVGIADVLRFQNMGEPYELNELEKKMKGLQEALAKLDTAISIDETYADAYAMRAKLLEEMRNTERHICQQKDEPYDFEEIEKQYNEQMLKDINRAIALNASNKADMYQARASYYLGEAYSAEYGQSAPEIIENYFDRALADINQAIALCREGDLDCFIEFYDTKSAIYRNARNHYIRAENPDKEKETEELADYWYQKALDLARERDALYEKELEEIEALLETSEIGKLENELEYGWRERVLGSQQELEGLSDEEKEKIGEQKEAAIKKRIASGTASAEDHLLMAMFDFDAGPETCQENYEKGIALFEERNPQGREALLLVRFYIYKSQFHVTHEQYDQALYDLNKAKTVVDSYFIQAQNTLSMTGFQQIAHQIETEGNLDDAFMFNQAEAEAFYWLSVACQIPYARAAVYEKLDLPAKAMEEYRYLCETFQDEEACKSVERLR